MIKGRKQGDYGMGEAIKYFTSIGNTVNIPLTDTQDYDLIADNGKLNKIQVKTCYSKQNGIYRAELRTRTHQKGKLYSTKTLGDIDYLFIHSEDGKNYLIPDNIVKGLSSIFLGKKYKCYIV
jgi:hypothetical protein